MPAYFQPAHTQMGTPVYKLPVVPKREPGYSAQAAREALAAKMKAKYEGSAVVRSTKSKDFKPSLRKATRTSGNAGPTKDAAGKKKEPSSPLPGETVREWKQRGETL